MLEDNSSIKLEIGSFAFPNIPTAMLWAGTYSPMWALCQEEDCHKQTTDAVSAIMGVFFSDLIVHSKCQQIFT